MTCSVELCRRPVDRRGLCSMHASRLKRHGDVNGGRTQALRMPAGTEWVVGVWARLDRRAGGCWLWVGPLGRTGRPRYHRDGRTSEVYRDLYELLVEPVDADLELDHLCLNGRCCNPMHLEPVTRAENMRRRSAAQTHCVNGHAFDEANTYRRSDNGCRVCRACNRAAHARRRTA